jgi:hypothetical protein
MYVAGHDHKGAAAFDQNQIYHLTLASPLNCDLTTIKYNYAILHFHPTLISV